ncbi:AI-2E family transporter [Reinekea sp.]|jgi:predicted PurR-regulated permease PerM|uniref:AI-2E family transporter n=1 Tax=Reinekea sp. TaxID=1970455 RepID=UPI002A7F4B96|nr:AI-2E family transporter [Reinekea sp.]
MISWLRSPGVQSSLVFLAIVLVFVFFSMVLAPVLISVLVSFVLYTLLGPVNNSLVRTGLGRNKSAGILLLAAMILVGLPLLYLIPIISEALAGSAKTVGSARTNIEQVVQLIAVQSSKWGLSIDSSQIIDVVNSRLIKYDQNTLISASNYFLSVTGSLLLVPFITFFLIRDYGSLRNRLMAILPNRFFELGWLIYFKVADQLQMYVRSVIIQQGILAIIASIGFWLAGYPAPIVLGLIVGILSIIPYIGPALGLLPPLVIAISMEPFNLWFLLSAGLVIVVAYTIDNVLVVPVLIAGAVNLHPLLVIVGIIIFGNALGMWGMILAIPFLAVAKILYRELFFGLHSMHSRQNT